MPRHDNDSSSRKTSIFTRFAHKAAAWTGRPETFFIALALVVLWALSGPFFGYSDTWQLVINTSTTIVTFLMVFVIQNSQNRDTAAMQIKLDELIVKLEGARDEMLDLEELDQARLEEMQKDFCRRARRARKRVVATDEASSTESDSSSDPRIQ